MNWSNRAKARRRLRAGASAAALLACLTGCGQVENPVETVLGPATLNIGFGLTTGQTAGAGMREIARGIAAEGLVVPSIDGRPQARLAESWSVSPDGLVRRIRLRSGVSFHDGVPATAQVIKELLLQDLPPYLGAPFSDVSSIEAPHAQEIELRLKRPSNLVLEGLDVLIQRKGDLPVGTGPYLMRELEDQIELSANDSYHSGRPAIDRIVFTPYVSVRSAWAEMLRGEVDMLYDVGVDAMDSLSQSNEVNLFSFRRAYAHTVVFNMRRPLFRDGGFRRRLNAAVNRQELVESALRGRGSVASAPIWPRHWAFDSSLPTYDYRPEVLGSNRTGPSFTALYFDESHEKLGLILQRQLQEVGVTMALEHVAYDRVFERLEQGDFDAFLADLALGPNMFRAYRFLHSSGPLNWGRYNSAEVDSAFDAIRGALTEPEYKTAVANLHRALVNDPPAIFLAWSERARAVSRRFDIPDDPDRDILSTLRLWRPAADKEIASSN
jgi:peptide/nickel transport system substrate-binding protein